MNRRLARILITARDEEGKQFVCQKTCTVGFFAGDLPQTLAPALSALLSCFSHDD